jgi:hypothetical protein
MTDQSSLRPPCPRPLVPGSERRALANYVTAELSVVRAIVTLALPIVIGRWIFWLGMIAALPCAAYFGWQVVHAWRQFVRGHNDE